MCHALGAVAPPVSHPALKRAMTSIVKRELSEAKTKMFINRYLACGCCFTPALAAWSLAQDHGCQYGQSREAWQGGAAFDHVMADGLYLPTEGAVRGTVMPLQCNAFCLCAHYVGTGPTNLQGLKYRDCPGREADGDMARRRRSLHPHPTEKEPA